MSTPRTPPTPAPPGAALAVGSAARPSTPDDTGRSPAAPVHALRLNRVRWAIRATLLLGVAASVTANVLHAQPNPISKAIAAWPPLALLLTVELISKVPVHRRSLATVRLLATTAIAGIAAYVSYWHMVAVADRYGETGVAAYLLPLSVDGLIVVVSISLVELAGRMSAPAIPPPLPQAAAPRDTRAGLPELRPAAAARPSTPPAAKPGDGRAEQGPRTPVDRPARTFVLPDGHAHNGWARPAPANGHPVPNGLRRTHVTTTDARPPGQRPTADGDASAEPHEGHSVPDRATSVDPDREGGHDRDVVDKHGEDHHSGAAAEHSEAQTSATGHDGEPHESHGPPAGAATDGPDHQRDPDGSGAAERDGEENHDGGEAVVSLAGERPARDDDPPPEDTPGAVAYWHRRHPDWGPKQIASKIDKSERTVRRWLPDKADTVPPTASGPNGAAPARRRDGQPAD